MKIAVWHNLPSGGGKRALFDQVRGLVANGHTVEAWRPDSAVADFLPLDRLIPENVLPLPTEVWPPKDTSTKRWLGVTALKGLGDSRRLASAMQAHAHTCAEAIQARGFDVVLAHPCRFFYAPHIGRYLRGIPKLLYLQEPLRHLYEAMPTFPWLPSPHSPEKQSGFLARWGRVIKRQVRLSKLRLQGKEEQLNAHSFDGLLANSYYSAESIQRAYGISPRVSYLGVDETLFPDLGLPRDGFVVGLGSLSWIKGVDLAIETVALLPPPRPKLVWICNSGDPAYRVLVEDQARRLEVDLEICQALPEAEVVRLLNRASVMLYTSRLEPFGYAPLEANLCGTPVVAVAEGGVRETVRDGINGYTAPRDPAALAAVLGPLLADPVRLQNLGHVAREHVRSRWSIAQSVLTLESHLLRNLPAVSA